MPRIAAVAIVSVVVSLFAIFENCILIVGLCAVGGVGLEVLIGGEYMSPWGVSLKL